LYHEKAKTKDESTRAPQTKQNETKMINHSAAVQQTKLESNNQVLAATAGLNSWKNYVGRSHGGNAVEWLDYLRLAKKRFFPVPLPTKCPICLEAPEEASGTGEWYTTAGCRHAFCLQCFRDYAANQVRDPDHRGTLQCPQCLLPLREADAVFALAHDPVILQVLDQKMRDLHLRAADGFRQCPHCAGSSVDGGGVLGRVSGGFVTQNCLGLNENRRVLTKLLLEDTGGLVLGPKLWVFWGIASIYSAPFPVKLASLTILSMTWIVWVCIEKMQLQKARKIWLRQIVVECPCCTKPFLLNAEAELSDEGGWGSDEWIQKNSRPCPNCFVPITKNGGCDRMKCTSCGTGFWWNEARTPFGNAQDGAFDPFAQYKDRPLSIGLDVATFILAAIILYV
jgi:hypothetical protein